MAQSTQPEKPEDKKIENDELTPEDLDDVAGGTKPAFIREDGPIFVQ